MTDDAILIETENTTMIETLHKETFPLAGRTVVMHVETVDADRRYRVFECDSATHTKLSDYDSSRFSDSRLRYDNLLKFAREREEHLQRENATASCRNVS